MKVFAIPDQVRYFLLSHISFILPVVAGLLITITLVCEILTGDLYMGAVTAFFALAFWTTCTLFTRKRKQLEFMLSAEKRKLLCSAYQMPYKVKICELLGLLAFLLTCASLYRVYFTWHPKQTTDAVFQLVAFGYLWMSGYAWSYIDRARELNKRKTQGLCVVCAYQVAKSGPISRCPECGTPILD